MTIKQKMVIIELQETNAKINQCLTSCLDALVRLQGTASDAKKDSLQYAFDQKGANSFPPFSTAIADVNKITEKNDDMFLHLIQRIKSES